jgi:hypothetical protein
MGTIAKARRLREAYEHLTTESEVYPSLAAGVTVVSANTDWVYGAYATVVAASTITVPFHVCGVAIETCDENAIYQLQLYKAAADVVVATIRFAVVGGFFGNQVYLIAAARCEANDRIRARLASSNGTAAVATQTISIAYQEH